jgi:hypothetical protein
VPTNEFVPCFELLSDSSQKELTSNEIDSSTYGIGHSQVSFFFHSFVIEYAENVGKLSRFFLYKIEGEITDILFDRFEHKVLGDPRNFLL